MMTTLPAAVSRMTSRIPEAILSTAVSTRSVEFDNECIHVPTTPIHRDFNAVLNNEAYHHS